ncbi:MAG: permease prefix domain 1-containing protein [Bacilli bacterium]
MSIDDYLLQVFRGSFFPKQERQDRMEELRTHLETAVHDSIDRGLAVDEATNEALRSCGPASSLRAQLTKSAYGLSSAWIAGSITVFSGLFLLFAATLPAIPLASPSLMLCLALATVLLTTTRKASDRFAIAVALVPFCMAYLQFHLEYSNILTSLLLPGWFLYTSPYILVSLLSIKGYAALFLMGLLLFAWTRNVWNAAVPFLYSTAISLWPVIRDFIKYGLWQTTHDSVFWNPPPLESPNNVILLGVLARLIVLALTILLIRIIARRRERSKSAVKHNPA